MTLLNIQPTIEVSAMLLPVSGGVTLVSKEDFCPLANKGWYLWKSKRNTTTYVVRNLKRDGKWTTEFMHRAIMKPKRAEVTDHIDSSGTNNQRANLRVCTSSQNLQNRRPHKNNTSGFKGVSWSKAMKKWQATITASGKRQTLGYFTTPEAAYEAYCNAAHKYHGAFARVA